MNEGDTLLIVDVEDAMADRDGGAAESARRDRRRRRGRAAAERAEPTMKTTLESRTILRRASRTVPDRQSRS
jgi:hypothetical protein